jgi:uridine monophosphate synthetase
VIDKESLIAGLFDLGAIQFGEFTLKSGEKSPVYIDLRLLIARPPLLRRIAHVMQAYAANLAFDRLAAIPLSGLPIGVALSLNMDRPLIYPRLDAKQHGTGRYIEGIYKPGEIVLMVDDVISLGDAKLEAIALLEAVRLKVNDIMVLVDRQMGGAEQMSAKGYRVHSVLTLTEILDMLLRMRRVTTEQHRFVTAWLKESVSKHAP